MKDDGDSAFPVNHSIDGNWVKEPLPKYRGMTLRDKFADSALPALIIAASKNDQTVARKLLSSGASIDRGDIAEIAYQYADAMLEARKK